MMKERKWIKDFEEMQNPTPKDIVFNLKKVSDQTVLTQEEIARIEKKIFDTEYIGTSVLLHMLNNYNKYTLFLERYKIHEYILKIKPSKTFYREVIQEVSKHQISILAKTILHMAQNVDFDEHMAFTILSQARQDMFHSNEVLNSKLIPIIKNPYYLLFLVCKRSKALRLKPYEMQYILDSININESNIAKVRELVAVPRLADMIINELPKAFEYIKSDQVNDRANENTLMKIK